jgi:hypothetical protein
MRYHLRSEKPAVKNSFSQDFLLQPLKMSMPRMELGQPHKALRRQKNIRGKKEYQ